MAEASKNLAVKKQVENAPDLQDKNGNKITKFQTFDASYFIGKSYFHDDGSENYLIFQPVFKGCLKKVSQLLLYGTITLLQILLTFTIPKWQ